MADYVVTVANVISGANARQVQQIAGVAILRGQSLYLDPVSNTVKLFKANVAAPVNVFYGIALEDVAVGQPLLVNVGDASFNAGITIAAGAIAIGSGNNAGGIAPSTDNVAGWFLTVIGIGIGGNLIKLVNVPAGVST